MSDQGAENQAPAGASQGAAPAAKPGAAGPSGVVLDDRFQIDYRQPLPELDSPSAKAYAAVDKRTTSRQVFALICSPDIPHRGTALRALIDRPCAHVLSVFGAGTVDAPEAGERRFAVILERPGGRRLWAPGKSGAPINEKVLFERILPQLATAIDAMAQRGVTHRAIRPDNIFWYDEGGTQLVLGDCVSSLPGRHQPVVYETVGRSMATLYDRGEGNAADDYYALGVAVFALVAGREPARDGGDLAMTATKIVGGSFTAICTGAEMSAGLVEILRGLLVDDPEQRFVANDVKAFIGGRAIRSPRPPPEKRALQPFRFRGESFSHTRLMAMAFGAAPREAVKTMRDQRIDQWVRKSLLDSDLGEKLGKFFAPEAAVGTASLNDDQVCTLACALLDPDGPIRYKGLALAPDGFGGALAQGYVSGNRETVQAIAELATSDVLRRWLEIQKGYGVKTTDLENVFSHLKGYIADPSLGAGIERCLYALVPGVACRSSHVVKDQTFSLSELMPALDRAAKKAGETVDLVDRQVAAFICSRSRKAEGQLQAALKSAEGEGGKRLGMIALLAFVQKNYCSMPLEKLATWAAGRMGPTVATLHNREVRREIQEKLKSAAKSGDLEAILSLIGDKARAADKAAYKEAVKEYADCAAEVKRIEAGDPERRALAERYGTQAAFMIAYAILLISLVYSYFGVLAR